MRDRMSEHRGYTTMELRAGSRSRVAETLTQSRHRATVVSALTVVALGALAACGGSAASSPRTTASTTSSVTPLVVYSAQGYDSVVTKAFQQATGIPVKLDDDSTGPLLTKVAAERNNPQGGLLWVDGATRLPGTRKAGPASRLFVADGADVGRRVAGSGRPLIRADQHDSDGGADLQRGEGARGAVGIPGSPAATIQGIGRDERPVAVRADVSLHRRAHEPDGRAVQRGICRRGLPDEVEGERPACAPHQWRHAACA